MVASRADVTGYLEPSQELSSMIKVGGGGLAEQFARPRTQIQGPLRMPVPGWVQAPQSKLLAINGLLVSHKDVLFLALPVHY